MNNINTKSYWNNRFVTGDWEQKKGRKQTQQFALSQLSKFNISSDFSGTILDFGCGLGDALPIYHIAFPKAKLIGLDISNEAIEKCRQTMSDIGEFIAGDYNDVPVVDIIIASNVFEHLSDDIEIAINLKTKCKILYIIVPYEEELFQSNEHVNTYSEESFKGIPGKSIKVFKSKGWSEYGADLIFNINFKNVFKYILRKNLRKVRKQIMFRFE